MLWVSSYLICWKWSCSCPVSWCQRSSSSVELPIQKQFLMPGACAIEAIASIIAKCIFPIFSCSSAWPAPEGRLWRPRPSSPSWSTCPRDHGWKHLRRGPLVTRARCKSMEIMANPWRPVTSHDIIRLYAIVLLPSRNKSNPSTRSNEIKLCSAWTAMAALGGCSGKCVFSSNLQKHIWTYPWASMDFFLLKSTCVLENMKNNEDMHMQQKRFNEYVPLNLLYL